ncbi:MAG TPA: methyltransferase domain-containing protein [Vicinamibacteria bacterium]
MLEDADRETASPDYARRFAGPVGAWFLEVQARTVVELLAPWPRARVLDVGGGHGQLAQALLAEGHAVTVYGSAPDALSAEVAELARAGRLEFTCGDLLHAPFPDRGFDAVLAFRLLPHLRRMGELAAELARLARAAVIVDYPTRRSVNAVSGALFGLKKSVEGNTRPFTVFRDAEVRGAFAAAGLRPTARRPQFFAPMAVHRALGRAGISRGLEGAARALGLTRALGSPVVLRLERPA